MIARPMKYVLLGFVGGFLAVSPLSAEEASPSWWSEDIDAALGLITDESLEETVRFLASDVLRGRDTPSPELDAAAKFLAEQYEQLGLEPGGASDFFQTVNFPVQSIPVELVRMSWKIADDPVQTLSAPRSSWFRASVPSLDPKRTPACGGCRSCLSPAPMKIKRRRTKC